MLATLFQSQTHLSSKSHQARRCNVGFGAKQLALDAIRRIPRLAGQVAAETARFDATLQRHKLYIGEYGDDMPEVRDWRWTV